MLGKKFKVKCHWEVCEKRWTHVIYLVYLPPPFFSGSKLLSLFRYPLYLNPNAESIIIYFQATKGGQRHVFNSENKYSNNKSSQLGTLHTISWLWGVNFWQNSLLSQFPSYLENAHRPQVTGEYGGCYINPFIYWK